MITLAGDAAAAAAAGLAGDAAGLAVTACLLAAAVVAGLPVPRGGAGRRLLRAQESPATTPTSHRSGRLLAGAAAVVGIGTAVVVGGWPGVLAGALLGLVSHRVAGRLEPASVRRQRLAEAALLPLAADLLAVALRGGAPIDRACTAVAEALPGPLGDRLARVGRVLSLGGTPAQAWSELAPVTGANRLVRAAIRSAEHGSALAATLHRIAGDLRTDRALGVEAAARRAAVLIVLPLGLCFLPAFVLAGLVPVIVAVLGDVL